MTQCNEQDWVRQLLAGDERAADDFWSAYGGRLQAIAQARMSSRLTQRLGADDIVQSVCRTFFRRAKMGQFDLADGDDVWRLLCVITVNKIRSHARFHSRMKRGMNREASTSPSGKDIELAEIADQNGPRPDEAAVFFDEMQGLLDGLGDEEKQVVELKIQSFTNHEVAERLFCSERTVRRMLKRAQDRLQQLLDDSG